MHEWVCKRGWRLKIFSQPINQNPNVRNILRAVFVAVVIGLLVNLVIAFLLNAGTTVRSIGRIRWTFVAVPFGSYILIYLVDALRLRIVLSQFKLRVPYRDLVDNGILGAFFSNLTPFASGGQPVQVYHLHALGIDLKKSTNIIASRWVEHLVTSLLVVGLAFHAAINLAHAVGAGTIIIYLGVGVSLIFAIVVAGVLFRPDLLARAALRIERSPFGRLISRIVRQQDWGEHFVAWSLRLKEEVSFLWREKLHIMLLDTLLGFANLLLQVYSLLFVLQGMTGRELNILQILVTFVTVNLVAYFIPTPGGSGSIEGIYSLVFSGFTGQADLTFVAIVVWRFATYYLHVFLGLIFFVPVMRRVEALTRAGGR